MKVLAFVLAIILMIAVLRHFNRTIRDRDHLIVVGWALASLVHALGAGNWPAVAMNSALVILILLMDRAGV